MFLFLYFLFKFLQIMKTINIWCFIDFTKRSVQSATWLALPYEIT